MGVPNEAVMGPSSHARNTSAHQPYLDTARAVPHHSSPVTDTQDGLEQIVALHFTCRTPCIAQRVLCVDRMPTKCYARGTSWRAPC